MSSSAAAPSAKAASYAIQARAVTMPCLVRDAGSASVVYLVDAAVAQRFVGDAWVEHFHGSFGVPDRIKS